MSTREIMERMALDRIYPPLSPWLHAGIIASTIFNVMTTKETRKRSPLDYVPKLAADPDEDEDEGDEGDEDEGPQSAAEARAILGGYVRAGMIRPPKKG